MAGQDELEYLVRFRADEESLSQLKAQIQEVEQAKAQVAEGGSGATEETTAFRDAVDELNESNETGIERLIELQEAIDGYKATLNEVKQSKKDKNEVTKEELESEQEAQMGLKTTRQEYRRVQQATIAASQAGEGQARTYNEIVAENKQLASAMRDIPLDDQSGKLEELKERWSENNEELKEFDSELGDHRRNVGNYSEVASTAASAIASIQGPLGPIAGRLNSLNTTLQRAIPILRSYAASWRAVRAAMLGLIGVAVVGFLGAIVAALREMQPVIDRLSKRIQQLSSAWSHFVQQIGAAFGMNESMNRSFAESIRLAGEQADEQNRLAEQMNINKFVTAELEAEVRRLRRAAEDQNLTERERIDLLEQAMQAERERFRMERQVVERRLEMLAEEHEMEQILGSSQQERALILQRQMDLNNINRGEMEEIAEVMEELAKLESDEEQRLLRLDRRRQNLISSIRTEIRNRLENIEALKEEAEESLKASQERAEARQKEGRATLREVHKELELERLLRNEQEEKARQLEKEIEIDEARREAAKERAQVEADMEEFIATKKEQFLKEGLDEAEAALKARLVATNEFADEMASVEQKLQSEILAIQDRFRGDRLQREHEQQQERMQVRQKIEDLEARRERKQVAESLARRSDKHEEMIRLEQKQAIRENELRSKFLEKGFDERESQMLAQHQAELELWEEKERTKTQIEEREEQRRLDMMEASGQIATGLARTLFGDIKEIRIAEAIVDTYSAANRALASSSPPLSYLQAAAAVAQGMANVRQIAQTDIGSSPGGGGQQEGGSSRAFEIIDRSEEREGRNLPGDAGGMAQEVAERSDSGGGDLQPIFHFEGDLNEENMAIKVRKGNKQINTKASSVNSRR